MGNSQVNIHVRPMDASLLNWFPMFPQCLNTSNTHLLNPLRAEANFLSLYNRCLDQFQMPKDVARRCETRWWSRQQGVTRCSLMAGWEYMEVGFWETFLFVFYK